ncbi:MAG: RNA polymerase sigma factor [Myxococcota bacterium]|nr:RNA polymerase sigma factor [Myxococcota bacterium]
MDRASDPQLPRAPRGSPPVGEVREMASPADDAELVRRARDGDRWAEEALYRRHVRRVTDTATRVLGRMDEAEDVVQDTFLKAFAKLHTLRDPALFPRWLLRIAMNRARGKLRKRKVMRSLGLDHTVDDATLERFASRETPADVRLELAGIDAALREVAPDHRIAWMLHEVEGLSLPEAADACNCSLATVKRWIRKAKDRIEAHIEEAP